MKSLIRRRLAAVVIFDRGSCCKILFCSDCFVAEQKNGYNFLITSLPFSVTDTVNNVNIQRCVSRISSNGFILKIELRCRSTVGRGVLSGILSPNLMTRKRFVYKGSLKKHFVIDKSIKVLPLCKIIINHSCIIFDNIICLV